MKATIVIPTYDEADALPELLTRVLELPEGFHVLVVDDQDTVQYRAVQLGDRHGELRAVTGGVQAGERVVASGLMRIKLGMKVRAAERAATAG